MSKENCKTCWAKWGVELWAGRCVCTGHVILKKPEPTFSNPVPPPIPVEYKVMSYGDRFVIRKVEPDGRSSHVGPMHYHGETPKGKPFPKELLENFKTFSCKEEAETVLEEYLNYLSDIENKNHKKKP